MFRELKVVSAQRWRMSPRGQHIELGIAENNLFLLLAALGLQPRALRHAAAADRHGLRSVHRARPRCAELRLLPGCPLHARGHAVGPDPGAGRRRASDRIHTPLIGMGQPGLLSFEPAYVDELAVLMRFGAGAHAAAEGLARSTCGSRPAPAAARAHTSAQQQADIVAGGYWSRAGSTAPTWPSSAWARSRPRRSPRTRHRPATSPAPGLLAVTSPDRLHADWLAAQRNRGRTAGAVDRSPAPVERLLAPLSRDAALVTVLDGHPRRCRGWAACAASAWCRSASIASASRATSPTSTAPTSSTRQQSSTPWPAPSGRRRDAIGSAAARFRRPAHSEFPLTLRIEHGELQ